MWVTLEFEAWHRWPDAPAKHEYLRSRHRHLFKVRIAWEVAELDREFEFIERKRDCLEAIERVKPLAENWSCETWATELRKLFGAASVSVSEDGENGAEVEAVG